MAGIEYVQVEQAARQLLRDGHYPSVSTVRHALGTGSASTVHRHLKTFWGKLGESMAAPALEGMPDTLAPLLRELWDKAVAEALERFNEQRLTLEQEKTAAAERAQAAQQEAATLREQLADSQAQSEAQAAHNAVLETDLQQWRERLEVAAAERDEARRAHQQDRRQMATRLRTMLHRERELTQRLETAQRDHADALARERARGEAQEQHWVQTLDNVRQDAKDRLAKAEALAQRLARDLDASRGELHHAREELKSREGACEASVRALREEHRERIADLQAAVARERDNANAHRGRAEVAEQTLQATGEELRALKAAYSKLRERRGFERPKKT